MNLSKSKYLGFFSLLVIILLATFLRVYRLDSIPNSLTIDEVNNGYSAYSILKTGRDEWGIKFPPYFRMIGDYTAPILIYLTVPSVWLFGLNEFGTRFSVALFSILTIPLFYLVTKRYIFKDKPHWLSVASTIFLTTSQWHIFYSRSDFEAVISLYFVLLNVYFLYRTVESKRLTYFYLATFLVILSAVTYNSNKVFALINISFLLLNWSKMFPLFKSELKNNRNRLWIFIILFLFSVGLFLKLYMFGPGAARAKMVFFSLDYDFRVALMRQVGDAGLNLLRFPLLLTFWFKRFLEYFSLNYYIFDGLGLTISGHPGSGVLNIALVPFYFIGLFFLLLGKSFGQNRITNLFILSWLVIGILPATLANNSQHPLRSLNTLIAIIWLSIIGISIVFDTVKKYSKRFSVFIPILFVFIYGLDFVRFVDYYVIHYPYELSELRQHGWKENAIYANSVRHEYDNIYVDPRFGTMGRTSYGVPYTYFLFYSQYDPQKFQNFPGRDGFNTDFENYHFQEIDLNQAVITKEKNLYIASPWSFPKELQNDKHILYKVKFLNGNDAFYGISDIKYN